MLGKVEVSPVIHESQSWALWYKAGRMSPPLRTSIRELLGLATNSRLGFLRMTVDRLELEDILCHVIWLVRPSIYFERIVDSVST